MFKLPRESNDITEWAEFSLVQEVSEDELLKAAAAMQQAFLQKQDGYLSRQLLSLGEGRYADIVAWRSREAADRALARANDSSICRNYFALMRVEHSPKIGTPLLVYTEVNDSVQGMEFSLFQLRPGTTEQALDQAVRRMVTNLYDGESGFQGHMVMRSDENHNLLADVVFADSAERARNLCGKWGQGPFEPACMDYLNLIEPVSVKLEFWNRVV